MPGGLVRRIERLEATTRHAERPSPDFSRLTRGERDRLRAILSGFAGRERTLDPDGLDTSMLDPKDAAFLADLARRAAA